MKAVVGEEALSSEDLLYLEVRIEKVACGAPCMCVNSHIRVHVFSTLAFLNSL